MRVLHFVITIKFLLFTIAAQAGGRAELPLPTEDHDYYDRGSPATAQVELGRNLFFDKILSGNFNISCATCHHPMSGAGDGLSLPVGEGGRGLGMTRDTGGADTPIAERVPRNSPALFNLGAREFDTLFHDGRVTPEALAAGGFASPAGDQLPPGLDNVLAVQAMFPVTSGTEMAGQAGENEVADAAALGQLSGPGGVWDLLAFRLQSMPAYVRQFRAAFPRQIDDASDITFVHAANAIAAFEARAFRFDDSPFDRFLRGGHHALSKSARAGMKLFYGKAGCASCHQGIFQTDHDFHAIAMPQIGPGKGDQQPGYHDGLEDFGRERVSGNPADRYRFRTPSLRNVLLTAPYGHAGAYATLEAVIHHHLDPVKALHDYESQQAELPRRADLDDQDFVLMNDEVRRQALADANELSSQRLSHAEMQQLVDFLAALTDPAALDMRSAIPATVPSGLPVWD